MEPLTIVTGCASLLGSIANLSKLISGFVRDCRDARTDMDMVRRELTSLSSVLELIEGDVKEHSQNTFPATLARQIDGIVNNCDGVLSKIAEVLQGRGGVINEARWAMGRKERVLELRTSLEAHKTSLELALDLVQLNLARETNSNTRLIISDTQEIRDATGIIAQDTRIMRVDMGVVLEELERLRVQVARQDKQSSGEEENVVLARYLEDMTSYAETVNGDIQDMATTPRVSLELVREVKGKPPAKLDVDRNRGMGEEVQVSRLEDAIYSGTINISNLSLESLQQGMKFIPRHPHPETDGLDLAPNLRPGEHFEGPQPESPWPPYSNNNQPSPYSSERSSSPKNQIPLILHPTTNPDLPRRTSRDVTMSQTSNLSVKNIREENAPQPLPQGDNENGKIVSTGSQIVDALPIRQLSPDSGQENPETTQGGLKIGRKLLAFFNRGKQNPTASTSSSASNVVGVHFRVGRKIGERSTFNVFEGINLLNGQPIAIMFEPRKRYAYMRDQYRTFKILAGLPGIPNVYYFGREGLHNILIMDLLGPSLEDLFDQCHRRFSIKTVVMVAKQMLHRVQSVHERNLIHRGISTDRLAIGRPGTKQANVIHFVDFRRAKQYRDPKTKQHIPYREHKSITGVPRYESINARLGNEQSRRDDLEALGYVIMYFLRGGLPWQGLTVEDLRKKKPMILIKDLCKGYPDEFFKYMGYVRALLFEEEPDYNYLQDLLTQALNGTSEEEDGIYDWNIPQAKPGSA